MFLSKNFERYAHLQAVRRQLTDAEWNEFLYLETIVWNEDGTVREDSADVH